MIVTESRPGRPRYHLRWVPHIEGDLRTTHAGSLTLNGLDGRQRWLRFQTDTDEAAAARHAGRRVTACGFAEVWNDDDTQRASFRVSRVTPRDGIASRPALRRILGADKYRDLPEHDAQTIRVAP